jgi:hypothetical protein
MPRTCTVCIRTDRDDIEQQLISGTSLRDIAGRTRLARSSLSRHLAGHLPATITEESTARDGQRANGLRERLDDLYQRAERILGEAEGTGRHNVSLASIRELRGILEFAAKLAGQPQAERVVIQLAFSDGTPMAEPRRHLEALPEPDEAG